MEEKFIRGREVPPLGRRISKSWFSVSLREEECEEVADWKRAGFASGVKPGSGWKVLPKEGTPAGDMRLAAGA